MKHKVTVSGVFPLERGGTLQDVTVEVRSWGKHRASATLICHALTGNADADDWWRELFGANRLFDPANAFILAMNVLGGCSGTTGPANSAVGNGEALGPDFPDITIRDMVRLQRSVLDRLGVHFLNLVVGGSMGGMQTLEWAAMYPDIVGTIVPIGVGPTQSAWAIAFSDTQRQAIVSDPTFNRGNYNEDNAPTAGLSTARMIAMCSYRSPQSFDTRFGRSQDQGTFSVQSYLRHQGGKLSKTFDANSYLALLDAMDSHDLGRGRGPLEAILRRINARALVIGISTDALYPVGELRTMSTTMPHAEFAILDSPHGHDSFLIATDQIGALVQQFLRSSKAAAFPPVHDQAWA